MADTVTAVVTRTAGNVSGIRQPSFRIRVTQGPDKGVSTVLTLHRFVIGSSQAADVRLLDPTVSALHCEVVCNIQGLWVKDLGSKNGVVVDGRRVSEAELHGKDDFRLGSSVVRIETFGEPEDRVLSATGRFGEMTGASVVMRDLFARLERAAESTANVLIMGETGTGKELAVEGLVQAGPRKDKPLVVVDCASLSPTLIESELFGHARGAFSGAVAAHAGAFERAHTGTLFLDEVGELPLELQPRLLGALERRSIQRLGDPNVREVDVRVLSATHRDLPRMVNRGVFRADLYFRIAGLTVRLPSLREHPEDIPALISTFMAELGDEVSIPPATLQHLYDAEYPGNVRELRNCVLRAAAGFEPDVSEVSEGKAGIVSDTGVTLPFDLEHPYQAQKERAVDMFERTYLLALLQKSDGSVADAARQARVNRVQLYQMLRRRRISLRPAPSR
jgi:transcriptional regulator with GAF, ATPase, and Fis domain